MAMVTGIDRIAIGIYSVVVRSQDECYACEPADLEIESCDGSNGAAADDKDVLPQ